MMASMTLLRTLFMIFPAMLWRTFLIATFLLSMLTACTSKEEAAKTFYARGTEYFERGQFDKARLEFLNAIQRSPQYADAYYSLGLIAKKEGDSALVFENMSIAMKLDAQNIPARINVAELMVYGQRFDEALKLANEILNVLPDSYDGARIKAAAYVGQKKYEKADKIIAKGLQLQPEDDALYGLKAVMAKEQGKLQESLTYLNSAIQYAEDKVHYLTLRAGLHRELGDSRALENDYRELIEASPEQADYSYALSRFLILEGRSPDAEGVLLNLTQKQPQNILAKERYVEAVLSHDGKRAREILDAMIKNFPGEASLRFLRIRFLMNDGHINKAIAELEKLAEEKTAQPFSEEIRLDAKASIAEIHIAQASTLEANTLETNNLETSNAGNDPQALQKRIGDALVLLQNNLRKNNQHEKSLLLMANYTLGLKDYDAAVGYLRTVLRNNPESEEGLVLLGHVYLQSGSPLLADDSFRQALDVNPGNLDAAIPVVRELMSQDNLERADKIAEQALERNPRDVRLIALLAQIKLNKKEWRAVEKLAERLRQIPEATNPTNSESHNLLNNTRTYAPNKKAYGYFLQGRLSQGEGDTKSAINYYRQALDVQPKFVLALQGLAAAYSLEKNEAGLLTFLEKFQKQNPNLESAYLLASQILSKQGKLEKALNQVITGLQHNPNWVKGYSIQVSLLEALNREDEAAAVYTHAIDLNPEDNYLKMRLAGFYETKGNYAGAAQLYKTLVRKNPNNYLAVNNYAALLIDKMPSEENNKLALELAKTLVSTSEPLFIDTYGWALVNTGDYHKGERYLREAAEDAAMVPDIYYHLGIALKKLKRKNEATIIFRKALRKSRGRPELAATIEQEIALLEE